MCCGLCKTGAAISVKFVFIQVSYAIPTQINFSLNNICSFFLYMCRCFCKTWTDYFLSESVMFLIQVNKVASSFMQDSDR